MFEKHYWNRRYQAIKDPTWPECNSIQDYHNLNTGIKNEIENVFKINVKDFLRRPEPYTDGLTMIDENHVRVSWSQWWMFTPAAVIHSKTDNTLSLHQSDPEQAMAACRISICHQFSKGKLYKCPVSMNLPDFIQQFPVDLSDDDKNTIMNYQTAQADWNDNDLLDFVQGLKNKDVISLCKFCTSNVSRELIYAGEKKIKIKKLSNKSPDAVIS